MLTNEVVGTNHQPLILAVLSARMEVRFASTFLAAELNASSKFMEECVFLEFLENVDDFIYHFEFVKNQKRTLNHYIQLKGSSERWLVEFIPVQGNKDSVQEVILVRRKEALEPELETQLAISRQQIHDLKFALDQASIVAFTDHRGRITYVNDKFVEISKFTRNELVGKTHKIINSNHHSKEFFKSMWGEISSGKVWNGEIRNKAKDGSIYWVDTTIVPFVGSTGVPYQYISIRSDITLKKQVQVDLERERSRTMHSEKMATLGVLSSGIAHELGNPLAALRGRLEMLVADAESGDLEPAAVKNTAERLIQLSDRMNKIIRGLRAYARDGSKDPFMMSSVSSLVADLLELVQNKCDKYGITVESEGLAAELPVKCRETEIGQVVVNLLNNSIDAIKQLDERWIRIKLVDRGDYIEFVITDSGKGIEQAVLDQIFNPFFTTKSVGQGTGLGLSISASLVESHHGKLEYINGENTCFKVTLPKDQHQAGD